MLIGMHELSSGGAIRLADIISIASPAKANPAHIETRRVKFDGDRPSSEMFEGEAEAIMRRPVQLMPAEPGIKRIWGGVEDDGDGHGRDVWLATSPVIAWAICFDGEIRLVTPSGVNDGSSQHWGAFYVEMPNGEIHSVGDSGDVNFFLNRDVFRTNVMLLAEEKRRAGA